MKIRRKLHLLTLLLFFSLISITGLSSWNWKRLQRLNQTVLQGQELLNKSQRVMGLMKDIIFDLFAPQMYSQIRSLTYAPRSVATFKTWKSAVSDYQEIFTDFLDDRELTILQDEELQDVYDTALTLNQKALEKLESISSILQVLQDMDREGENLYMTMQSDEALIPFFDEFRETSYYFTNTFESYMKHFFSSFRKQTLRLEQTLYLLFLLVSLLTGGLSIIYSRVLSREILAKILKVDQAFNRIAQGDFSKEYTDTEEDELSILLTSINHLSQDLKANIDGILNLTRNMGTSLVEGANRDEILALVAESIINDTVAQGAAIYLYDPLSRTMVLQAQRGDSPPLVKKISLSTSPFSRLCEGNTLFSGEEHDDGLLNLFIPGSSLPVMMMIPLMIQNQLAGFITAMKLSGEQIFSDLGIIRMKNFAQYVALALDNHTKYREVLEKREAQYNALQSQVQPHFIYNVLNGFIGLNRRGNKDQLEKAILSLREMLRYVTDHKRWVSLYEEIQFLITYCELQKIRFGDRLTYSFTLPRELSSFPIPKLLLQPLVENAIVHGLEPLESGGHLELKGSLFYQGNQKRVVLTLDDSGAGFIPDFNDKANHVGLRNVTERLKMAYPGSEILIHSQPGEGTSILMTIIAPETHSSEVIK